MPSALDRFTKQTFQGIVTSGLMERDIFGVILGVFWPIQKTFVVREPLCDLVIPS